MSLSNKQIAEVFENIADILEIQGESRFKFLAYRRAAETLAELPRSLQAYADDNTLEDLPGVGKAIAEKIRELLASDKLEFYEKRKAEVPLGVLDVKRLNGVGPKKARLFWEQLGITSIEALKQAAEGGKLRDLPGMGAKSEQKILESIEAQARRSAGRTPLGKAKPAAEGILAELLALDVAQKGVIAGSIRRGRPTIGDVDILIASEDAAPIMDKVVNLPQVARVLGHGETKSSVELASGLQVDVRVLPPSRWGTAVQYFSGSQAHNIKLRQIALQQGYSLNESALSPVDEHGDIIPDAEKRYYETEEALYADLGLQWVPPELREDAGELELARQHKLPDLITIDDIQADLHMHSTWSDGKASVRAMAEAAKAHGLKYIVITDHSQRSVQANGLSVERLLQQRDEVQQVDAEMGDSLQVLHGVEMDIREDGSLDYPDEVLAQLDFVIASLHMGLNQKREQITQRLLNAIRSPHVDLIAHPTARLIGDRDAVDADMDVVFQAALEHNTPLEINSNPRRLDLDAQYVRRAVDMGVLLAINTDAHSTANFALLPYGILTARRGWAQAAHVINTWDYVRFREWVDARGSS